MDIFATFRTNIGQMYLKAQNKPKYSNILHVLEVSTIFYIKFIKEGNLGTFLKNDNF